jgi:hypothetical protein
MAVLNSFGPALDVLNAGAVDAGRMVTHTFNLEEIPEALAVVRAGAGLKVQIAPAHLRRDDVLIATTASQVLGGFVCHFGQRRLGEVRVRLYQIKLHSRLAAKRHFAAQRGPAAREQAELDWRTMAVQPVAAAREASADDQCLDTRLQRRQLIRRQAGEGRAETLQRQVQQGIKALALRAGKMCSLHIVFHLAFGR